MSRSLIISLLISILIPHISFSAVTLDRIEASVNDSLILLTDIHHFRKTMRLRAQLDPLFSGTPLASHGNLATAAETVQFLIDEKIILQQFLITDTEVEQEINSIQANNKIDRSSLKKALEEQGYSFDDYFSMIRISTAKRNLIDRDIRTKVNISDEDVKNYFYNHYIRDTAQPRSYRLKIITVSKKNYKTLSAARETVERALKELKTGESFEEIAKRISDDPTAELGGDLGTLSDDQISQPIRQQLNKFQIGQVSDLIWLPEGKFVIVKLTDISTGQSDRFEKAKEEIRQQLITSEYQHQISLWLERQRQIAFIHRAGEPSVAGLPTAYH